MLYFFEQYSYGNFDAIRKRYSYNEATDFLSDRQIWGIYQYLGFLSER